MNRLSYCLLMVSAITAIACWFMLLLVSYSDRREYDKWAEYFVPRATLLVFGLVIASALFAFLAP